MKSDHLTYHESKYIDNTRKLRDVLSSLPDFTKDYFRGMQQNTSAKTRISYAYDIRIFFQYLLEANPSLKHKSMDQITLSDLENLKSTDIEEFLDYLKVYTDVNGKLHKNDEKGLHRKLASLRSFFSFYQKHEMMQKNPTVAVNMPKLHEHEIIRLEADEVASLLDFVEHGSEKLTGMKKVYFDKNRIRNLALFTLLLGTGIRVSECVGLDLDDVDFRNQRIKVIRKGGNEDFVYFGDEVTEALNNYIEERKGVVVKPGHENALFLSIQKRRISVQAIEDLVKENARYISTVKHITPHKLRSTYGTSLYRETQDIYLVAEVLGHNDVNTTRKHYAALDDDIKRAASNKVRLRTDNRN